MWALRQLRRGENSGDNISLVKFGGLLAGGRAGISGISI